MKGQINIIVPWIEIGYQEISEASERSIIDIYVKAKLLEQTLKFTEQLWKEKVVSGREGGMRYGTVVLGREEGEGENMQHSIIREHQTLQPIAKPDRGWKIP